MYDDAKRCGMRGAFRLAVSLYGKSGTTVRRYDSPTVEWEDKTKDVVESFDQAWKSTSWNVR